MHYCERMRQLDDDFTSICEALTATGKFEECGEPAAVKADGRWLCAYCYDTLYGHLIQCDSYYDTAERFVKDKRQIAKADSENVEDLPFEPLPVTKHSVAELGIEPEPKQ